MLASLGISKAETKTPTEGCEVIHVFITSQLDFCNSFYRP